MNGNCTFNCNEKETSLHLLYECAHTQALLRKLNVWLTQVHHKYCIPVNKLNILFGMHNEDANSEKNIIIMVAKKYIWIQEFKNVAPSVIGFQNYFYDFLIDLKAIFAIKNDTDWFAESWDILLVHLHARNQDGSHI